MDQVRRGVLGAVGGLDRWLAGVTAVFVLAATVRYIDRHDPGPVLAAAVVLTIAVVWWAARHPRRPAVDAAFAMVVVALWAGLTFAAPSFAWVAVPLAFIVLRSLPQPSGGAVVLAMALVVVIAGSRLSDRFDPTLIVGPLGLAGIAVAAYHGLQRESERRQSLLDELTAAQELLVAEQRTVGALRERTRLAREIHDSVGQGLSSIVLLLDAARRSWESDPDRARENVTMAEGSARHELVEVRRVIGDLAPAAIHTGEQLVGAIDALLRRDAPPEIEVELRVDGDRESLAPGIVHTVLATVRGAVANSVEHARASRIVVTLVFHPGRLTLDVHDDGRGFDPTGVGSAGERGRGLGGLRSRAEEGGGEVMIESTVGEGTTVSLHLPLEEDA